MLLEFHQHAALALALLAQLCHAALPAPAYHYATTTGYVEVINTGLARGVYHNVGQLTPQDWHNLAMRLVPDLQEATRTYNNAHPNAKVNVPHGASIYNSAAGHLIIGGIGAGVHGEVNVQRICAANALPFTGGRIGTLYYPAGENAIFIRSCPACSAIINPLLITDIKSTVPAVAAVWGAVAGGSYPAP